MSAEERYDLQGLLPLVAAGDETSFSRLYHSTNARVFNAVMSYVKDTHTAQEIVQLVYIRIWDHRSSLEQVRSVENYLFILARNAVFDHLRVLTREAQRLRGYPAGGHEYYNNVMAGVEERENGQLIRRVVAALPPRQRQVYLLADEHEMSYDEIAARMQVSRFTVKRHLELARRYIRKYVQHYLREEITFLILAFLSIQKIFFIALGH